MEVKIVLEAVIKRLELLWMITILLMFLKTQTEN